MRNNYKHILTLSAILLLFANSLYAQYPGGVSTGTTRGYKVDYYNGSFSNMSQFGAGTANNIPGLTGYSNTVTGTEYVQIDADYYGTEYTGILEIPVTGNYTFSVTADDAASLYIDGLIKITATASGGAAFATVNLTAGDHTVKVKHYEYGGAQSASLKFTATPVGSGITTPTDVDGRFVRSENSKMTAWYKASDITVTADYGGSGIDKVNRFTNKAPDYLGFNDMPYNGSDFATKRNDISQVNFNPGVRFGGDDSFVATTQKALSYRGATKTLFMVNDYTANASQAGIWMFFHGDNNTAQRVGLSKIDTNTSYFDCRGSSVSGTSTYTANEPKLLVGSLGQVLGGGASSTTNPATIGINGTYSGPANVTVNADAEDTGLIVSNMNVANFPEAIYYPFELSLTERQKVNTYLGLKYGISLAHDYISTSGTTVFSLTTNSGYTNRIFGIGQELAVEGLSQKQSQSQMASTTGYDFLVVSKGAVAATNADNSGTLADGDYLLFGDNNGALASQTTEIPSSFASTAGCVVNRIGREWKAQVSGAPGAVTIVAGSSGSFMFPGSAAGLNLLVDTDGDGDFTTGTPTPFPVTSITNGIATFDNVTIPNGAVITFAWSVTSPGGVYKPSSGITITTGSGTTSNNINGLAYKLYSTNTTVGTGISTGFGAYSPTLLGSGYYNNTNNFQGFVVDKISDYYGVELTGKLLVSSGSSTFQFRGDADDQLALIIDGNVILNIVSANTVTSANINLTTGYHDIIVRGRELSGAQQFNLTWNNGSGSTFFAIPDANFFVSPTGPSAWYKTDDSNFKTLADNTVLTGNTWMDQSGNGNNAIYSNGTPTYYSSNNTYITNYNPSINIGGSGWFKISNYLQGFAYGKQGKTIAGVGSASNEATMRLLSGYGLASVNDMFGIGKDSGGGSLIFYGYSNAISGSPVAFGSTATTQLMGGIYKNNNIISTNNATLYFNNASNGTATKPWSTNLNGTQAELFVGTSPSFGSNGWNGTMNEVIYYPWDLSATELTRVNTYLAIKYSTPLSNGSGTSASDYLASDGITKPWVGNATYKYGMFGIGRDDCSGLMQKQSKLGDGTDNVAVGLTAIAASNASNAGSFSTNKQFLMIGNDGGALSGTNTNIPTAYVTSSCNAYRYIRNWKVKNTNNVTNILQLIFGDNNNLIPSNWTNIKLAINSAGDTTFTSGTTTLISPTSVNGGAATFDNVVLSDGAIFTLFYTAGYPGGVYKPSVGTSIGGQTYINGVAYKLYSTNGTASRDLIASSLGSLGTDTLLGSGYYNNISDNFESFITSKKSSNYGVQLTGKILAPRTGNYQFRTVAPDDNTAFIINGITAFNVTGATGSTINSVVTITLTAGQYYDFTYICRGAGTPNNFNLQWDGVTAGSFAAIADTNLFVLPNTGPSAWFTADDSVLSTLSDGDSLVGKTWTDQSGNANNLPQSAGSPVYYKTNTSYSTNYNPRIFVGGSGWFNYGSTNYLNGFAYGMQGKTTFGVGSATNDGTTTRLSAYGDNTNNDMFGIGKNSTGNLTLYGFNTALNSVSQAFGSTASTQLMGGIYMNNNIVSLNNATIYLNNASNAATKAWSTSLTTNGELLVGTAPTFSGNAWVGNINEILYYPWNLSPVENQKINSYLAIKWGITLDQTTPTNYIASDGSIIWNASLNTAYKYDITGIGRDDCGSLNQKQSTSTDGSDIVGIGIGGISTSNLTNVNTFANDKSFLTFSNNNGSVTFLSSHTDIPSSLASCYTHFDRIWQVQTVNNPGAVTVSLGKKGLVIINASLYRPVLLVSNSTDFTNATVYKYNTYSQGVVYFDNVTFTNGQYFTMGYIPAGPGGVTAGLTTWFNSDYDVYTDVAQTTRAVNAGDPVKSINNLKAYATFADVEEVGASNNPTYQPGSFNYNAGVLFDGVDDVLASSGNINTTDYRTPTQMTSMLSGSVVGTGGNQNVFWYHDDGGGLNKTALERPQAFWGSPTGLFRNPNLTLPEIYTYANTAGGTWRLYSNLATVGSGNSGNGNTGTVNGRFRIGNNRYDATGSPANFILGEFTIFGTDLGAVTTPEMRRIHSYAATKYGFTLDKTAMGGAYVASDGTTQTFNYSTHWNRITGIGRDDCSAFEQKQSRSSETGMMVKISNDPVNGLAATNLANTASFAANKSFELFGDDNKALVWTGVDKITDATFGNLVRLTRTWRVKETGTVGSVYLEVTGNGSSATAKLPAGATTSASVYLIVSTTSDFKNPIAIKEMIPDTLPNANKWSTSYDFADGNYYTFATGIMCLAPAGITDGLTSWYKFNNKSGVVTSINDDSPSGYTLAYAASSTSVSIATGSATLFNYNRYLPLTGTTYFEKLALNETSVYAVNAGTTFAVGNSTTKDIMGFGRQSSVFHRTGLAGNNAYFNDITNAYPASSNGSPNILVANTSPGGTSASKNHVSWNNGVAGTSVTLAAANLPSASDYNLRLGSITPGIAGVYDKGLAEGITYNRSLSVVETQITNSYLALKYGQTLAHNYYSPNYDGTNASTTTIYDVSTYGNRVFGIGNDIAGCFYQNQSTSALTGTMLKISVDGVINSENSQDKTVWPNNQTYIAIGDDNGDVNTSGWITSSASPVVNQPVLYTYTNSCAKRISRQWKITTTGTNPSVFITVPGSTSLTSTAKLPAIPVSATNPNGLYMVINDNPDFAINANQSEVLMTFNAATGDYETTQTFAAGVTKYITFVYRPKVCRNCIITNTATSTTRKN